jgi:hypothetical protein
MKVPKKKAQDELDAIRASLSRAVESADPQEWPKIVRNTIRRIELVIERLDKAPAQIGKKGGLVTAKRGSDYFRQLAAMRKTKAGGRPKADKLASDTEQT